MPPANSPFGFINANKPSGITSTAFGSRVRHALGPVALGHWGTLDPDAAGVLVLAVGHATRLLPLLGEGRKSYKFSLVLGSATATGDASGAVVESGDVPAGWQAGLPDVCASLVGPLPQIPPMYSAVKVGGQPLYKSARRGEEVARPAREVQIFAMRVLDIAETSARLAVECGAGTYVRSLCEEIGRRLGVPAHMDALVRTAAGPFTLQSACSPDAIFSDPLACLVDPLDVLEHPRYVMTEADSLRFGHGNAIVVSDAGVAGDVLVIVNDRIIGTANISPGLAGATVQPTRVFQ